MVPSAAVIVRDNVSQVAVLDDQQRVNYAEVKLGRDFGSEIEILSGLHEGQTVLVYPAINFPWGRSSNRFSFGRNRVDDVQDVPGLVRGFMIDKENDHGNEATGKFGSVHYSNRFRGAWAIGGGGWEFGWGPQDDRSRSPRSARRIDAGVNWIDTAAVYGLGHSKKWLREALDGVRIGRTSSPSAAWCGAKAE